MKNRKEGREKSDKGKEKSIVKGWEGKICFKRIGSRGKGEKEGKTIPLIRCGFLF